MPGADATRNFSKAPQLPYLLEILGWVRFRFIIPALVADYRRYTKLGDFFFHFSKRIQIRTIIKQRGSQNSLNRLLIFTPGEFKEPSRE